MEQQAYCLGGSSASSVTVQLYLSIVLSSRQFALQYIYHIYCFIVYPTNIIMSQPSVTGQPTAQLAQRGRSTYTPYNLFSLVYLLCINKMEYNSILSCSRENINTKRSRHCSFCSKTAQQTPRPRLNVYYRFMYNGPL